MKVMVLGSYDQSLITFRGPLIQSMRALGHDVLACAPTISDAVRRQLEAWGVICREIQMARTGMNPALDFRTVRQLYRLMREERPDVLFAYTVKPVVYGCMAARLARVDACYPMITGLGYAFLDGGGVRQRVVRWVVQKLYRQAMRASAAVFFQNPDDRDEFSKRGLIHGNTCCVMVNGSGVDTEYYAPTSLPPDPVFLLIARLITDKGIREYVDAARIARRHYPNARFKLAGWLDTNPTAVSQPELDTWIEEGVIEYLGKLDDVRAAVSESRIYVLPSYREGTPRTVLEAMSMGRAVITTDAPGCRETVENGVNGFLVPVGDVTALAEAMLRYMDTPELAERHASICRDVAVQKYDVHKVNKVILETMSLA